MLGSIYNKSFRLKAKRVEEWMDGKCLKNQSIEAEVIATVADNKIHFKLTGTEGLLSVRTEFSLDIHPIPFCVLPDRIQYSTMSDYNPVMPVVCQIFVNPEIYVRLAMTNPDRIIEFYGDFRIVDSSEEEDDGQGVGEDTIMHFNSYSHLRFEKGAPVGGMQECHRIIDVVENTNGCEGYMLQPGRGYIVKMFNPELGRPQMTDKPMEIVSESDSCLELRGFPLPAKTPFGWVEVDNRDYGLKIFHTNGTVDKCVLYMYDRDTYIEYYY